MKASVGTCILLMGTLVINPSSVESDKNSITAHLVEPSLESEWCKDDKYMCLQLDKTELDKMTELVDTIGDSGRVLLQLKEDIGPDGSVDGELFTPTDKEPIDDGWIVGTMYYDEEKKIDVLDFIMVMNGHMVNSTLVLPE